MWFEARNCRHVPGELASEPCKLHAESTNILSEESWGMKFGALLRETFESGVAVGALRGVAHGGMVFIDAL